MVRGGRGCGPAGSYEATARADAGIRTPDPIITSDVLYQLSYVGGSARSLAAPAGPAWQAQPRGGSPVAAGVGSAVRTEPPS